MGTKRQRMLATFIGLGIAAALVGGTAYWQRSFVHGEEACMQCGALRTVDRRGPFWTRSAPHWRPLDVAVKECGVHEWCPIGCWEQDGGFSRYAAVPWR
jgi:hypothetical protein